MIHAVIALGFCLLAYFVPYFVYMPLLIVGFYVGRELAQAEYRYIHEYCGGKRANMPWYAPFTPKAWTLKSMVDWIGPLAVVAVYFEVC